MTKSELKTGMIVVLADGKECMVFKDAVTNCKDAQNFIVATDGDKYWLRLSDYNEDLTMNSGRDCYNIVKVIQVPHPYSCINGEYAKDERKVLWTRKKRYTYAQLREILGEEFEVVSE